MFSKKGSPKKWDPFNTDHQAFKLTLKILLLNLIFSWPMLKNKEIQCFCCWISRYFHHYLGLLHPSYLDPWAQPKMLDSWHPIILQSSASLPLNHSWRFTTFYENSWTTGLKLKHFHFIPDKSSGWRMVNITPQNDRSTPISLKT